MFDPNYLKNSFFGEYGGRYLPEMLIPALSEVEKIYSNAKKDPEFKKRVAGLLREYAGRPTPLYYAKNLTKYFKGAKIYLKNESLLLTGAHKINNVIGQMSLMEYMKKNEAIAETGAGQHGLATATVAAKLGFKARIFMGSTDVKRQFPNVYQMKLLKANVVAVESGTKTLKDAINATLKYWVENLESAHYIIGSALGPFPYPLMVRDFQSIIGKEVKKQLFQREKKLPDAIVACVGGGSNSLGIFYPFLKYPEVKLIGVEAGGKSSALGEHASRFQNNKSSKNMIGVLQGYKSYFLQDAEGQIAKTHSISAGLDYPGISPELAHLYDVGRVDFLSSKDSEVLQGFKLLAEYEGIFPALESAHAIAALKKIAPKMGRDKVLVVNISGRGDKDIFITAKHLDRENWYNFLKSEQDELENELESRLKK